MPSKAVYPKLPRATSVRLWRLNWLAAALHLISAVILFVLTDSDATTPVYAIHANTHRGNHTLYGPTLQLLGEMPVGYLAGVFLLLAAVDHAAVASVLRAWYEHQLERSQNAVRWIEYSFSASVMHVMIAMLCGVMSLYLLIAIVGLTAATMLFGLLQERMNWRFQGQPQKKSMLPFWLGCIPYMFAWAILFAVFGQSASKAPAFVWVVMFGLFANESLFAANMYAQQRELGRWKSYIWGEYAFIILSFSAKSMLAWANFIGTSSL
jgi:hypothetical protein